jgi:hypothetical protein
MKATLSARKQSHDFRGGRINNMSVTMGSGLQARGADLISPRSVISEARQHVLSNTVTEGLSVRGGRKDGWNNADSTARNGLNLRDNNLTVQNIVDSMLKK